MIYAILFTYLAITFGTGFFLGRKNQNDSEGYFMANRNLGTFKLFLTLIATNFSAFFFLGFAGEGYKIGYAYYAMTALGTSLAAIGFYLIGQRAWSLGKEHGYITPVEMIGGQTNHEPTRILYLLCMLFFMFPYLAIQPIGAGLILENLTDGVITYEMGVIGMTLFIILHIIFGGMKGVVMLDVKNGILMLIFMTTALIVIAWQLGGITEVHQKLLLEEPELFSPTGKGNFFDAKKWISFMLLFGCSVSILPQLFSRFLISKNSKILQKSTLLYTIIPIFLFLLPVMIGMMGNLDFPGLEGKASDKILTKMLILHTPEWFAALILTGALAAFISTMDSVLLALATITSRDLLKPIFGIDSEKGQIFGARVSIVIFAAISLVIAFYQPASIFAIGKLALSGMAVLFPTVLMILRKNVLKPIFYFLAMLLGEFTLIGTSMKWFSLPFFDGWLPVIPGMFVACVVLLIGSFLSESEFSGLKDSQD